MVLHFFQSMLQYSHRELRPELLTATHLINKNGGIIMAFVITDECLSCGSCAAQCPAEAIEMGDLHYEIDAEKCLECGSCAAQCPAEAIVEK